MSDTDAQVPLPDLNSADTPSIDQNWLSLEITKRSFPMSLTSRVVRAAASAPQIVAAIHWEALRL